MRLSLTGEQDELRATVSRFFAENSPMRRIREVIDGDLGFDPALWKRMTGELGLAGLAIPEQYGGAGYGVVERSVVLEEAGATLVPSPFFASAVLAAEVLLGVGDEAACGRLLPGIAAGERIATVAISESDGGWGTPVQTSAIERDGGWALTGGKTLVVDGMAADFFLVYAQTSDGPGFFEVDASAAGLERVALRTFDPTRRMARLSFTDCPAVRIGADVTEKLAAIADRVVTALAAEQLGGLRQAMRMAVDYAKLRVQFGRVIGSYQAVKHLCVDCYVDWELANAAVRHASWVADESPAELPAAAAFTASLVGPAYFRVAETSIEIHGGIGFTWEHDLHFYYKRAKSSQHLLGGTASHRSALVSALGV
ncbi:acyl-CoA dehydrogenase family protein [Fodinicola feengrottensis]|uniref:Acyl-CoA dehydrogenase family protein n=1 Tax=Fodinicola feengrottensis TaxID=435914 RepID=A0ABN2FYS3_9ACTN